MILDVKVLLYFARAVRSSRRKRQKVNELRMPLLFSHLRLNSERDMWTQMHLLQGSVTHIFIKMCLG